MRVRRFTVAVALAAACAAASPRPAYGKAWQEIEPGKSTREDVVRRFGEPPKVLKSDAQEILAYGGKQALEGAAQVHFTVDASSRVEKIAVFPKAVLSRAAVEGSYGPRCAGRKDPAGCYDERMTEDLKPYLFYLRLGVAVFFADDDPSTVRTLLFTAPVKPHKPPPAPPKKKPRVVGKKPRPR